MVKDPRFALALLLAGLIAGCGASVRRHGYDVPDGTVLEQCEMPIQNQPDRDLTNFEVLGRIEVSDSGFSTDCDEAVVLHLMTVDACYLDADVVNIIEERRPDFWSTCYRAKADLLRLKEGAEQTVLQSDPKYAPDAVRVRAQETHRRNKNMVAAGIAGGLLGAAIAS